MNISLPLGKRAASVVRAIRRSTPKPDDLDRPCRELGSALVIMDEPTAALGLRERGAVEDLIGNLRKEGLAQLVISHDLEQVMRISDSIWVMRGGRTIVSYRTKDVDRARIAATIAGGEV